MDVLTKKESRSYDYISRYASFPYYYHSEDSKYIYGKTAQLKKNIPFILADVTSGTTLDELSNKYYGRPDYYWVIADFNNIQDPFINLFSFFNKIKVPSLASIEFEV